MKLNLIIDEKIQPKQSARFYVDKRTGQIRSYQAKRVKEFAKKIRYYFLEKYPRFDVEKLKDIPLKVEIFIILECPVRWGKIKKEKALNDEIRPTVKPDCDNIAKNILDSLNKIAYPDDKQIVELSVKKYYGNSNQIHIVIGTLNNGK